MLDFKAKSSKPAKYTNCYRFDVKFVYGDGDEYPHEEVIIPKEEKCRALAYAHALEYIDDNELGEETFVEWTESVGYHHWFKLASSEWKSDLLHCLGYNCDYGLYPNVDECTIEYYDEAGRVTELALIDTDEDRTSVNPFVNSIDSKLHHKR